MKFIGSGNAFGSGGCFNTGLLRLDRAAIDTILITHFHADHFGGLPFFILDQQLNVKRTKPLLVAGPPGIADRYERAIAAAFPGERQLPFPLAFRELEPGQAHDFPAMQVTPFHVVHDDRAGPCLAYRIEAEGKVFCYSGDTEWTDTLIGAARGADLFVCECYTFEKPRRAHMSLSALRPHLEEIGAKRVVLTHMGEDMLEHLADAGLETAEDGKILAF